MKLFTRPVPKHLVSSILREIRLQSLLGPGHMNLINVYEVLLTDDHLGIAMVSALFRAPGLLPCALRCTSLGCASMLDRHSARHTRHSRQQTETSD